MDAANENLNLSNMTEQEKIIPAGENAETDNQPELMDESVQEAIKENEQEAVPEITDGEVITQTEKKKKVRTHASLAKNIVSLVFFTLSLVFGITASTLFLVRESLTTQSVSQSVKNMTLGDTGIGFWFGQQGQDVTLDEYMTDVFNSSGVVSVQQKDVKKFLDSAFVKNFVTDRLNGYISDFMYGTGEGSINVDEVMSLLGDNWAEVSVKLGIDNAKVKGKTQDDIRAEVLTGVYNRESFFDEAESFIREHAGESMYMLASNIKDFKLVNELFGDDKGDEILEKEAELLKEKGAGNSVLGRIAGDRFVQIVLKKDFDEKYLLDNIKILCSLMEDRIYKLHVYAGVYEIKDVNEPVQTMYDKANMAIERIKGDYNQVISYYDESDMKRLMHEKSIVAEFDKALENGEFCMYLQPQLDSRGALLGAEALVRWNHPKRGLLYPDSFIGILEKTGIIYKLDNFIWEKAAEKIKEWNAAGYEDYHISVNISAKDFYYLDLYKVLTDIVRRYGIAPKHLNLEITETVIMSDVKMHMEILDRLQKFGFQIEIDDFGSGYSSLNTLKDIKADLLKIDMLFLRETDNQERSRKILKFIITMAKALNMDVITEGVETEKQLDFLSGIGCEMFQGFYFSKPIPVDKFEDKYFQS